MRILLDTNVLMWAVVDHDRLTPDVRATIEDQANEILFSTVSIWEIGIKAATARPDFPWNPTAVLQEALDAGFIELAITSTAAIVAAALPLHHRDPFDRMLLGQALKAPARLMTADALLARYSELVDVI